MTLAAAHYWQGTVLETELVSESDPLVSCPLAVCLAAQQATSMPGQIEIPPLYSIFVI